MLVLLLYYRKEKQKDKTIEEPQKEDKQKQIILRPTFQIVYSKEELLEEDIDFLADYVLSFDSLMEKKNVETKGNIEETYQLEIVKLSDINFNKIKRIQL